MEWKPDGAKNRKPIIFVGKGVVFDSGGMNLKPGDSMLNMKDDMSGAAAVAATIYAIAKSSLPAWVIGLMPATDALSYAKKYKPEIVIDLATLTGAAIRAVGRFGIVAMQLKAERELALLQKAGWQVYERLVELPSWDEYGEWIKSDLADLKNLGPGEAGAITAGKFLQKFTDYPHIHLDIAGMAFQDKRDSYRPSGGTGVGVRLLFNFVKELSREG